jgi:hypothetical protein
MRNCVFVWLNLCATFEFLEDAARLRCFKIINFAFEKARFFYLCYTLGEA